MLDSLSARLEFNSLRLFHRRYSGDLPIPATTKCYSPFGWLTFPVGTGSTHITSADDVYAPPDFDSGLYSR